MVKKHFVVFAILVLSFFIFAGYVDAARPKNCPIMSDTNVVVYGETGFGGVGVPSKSWITHFMDWWEQQDSSINYVFLDSADVKSDCDLSNYPNVKIYIQPGGNAYYMQRSLGSAGKTNILDFIDRDGGSYVGICAGFFYMAGDYYWQGQYYNWPDLLGRYPILEGSITDIADYDGNPGYALTTMDNGHEMIYYGGPTRGWRDTPSDILGEKLMSFSDIPGNLPASIKYNKMLLMSVHAEAYENDGISGLTTEQRIENYKWFANSVNGVAGTNFYVPPFVQPKQCADGIDNDGDNLIDMVDPGCASPSDNDETDLINVEVFFDGFESGSLSNWYLYGTGVPWNSFSGDSFEGVWSARAKQTGAGEDSFMEKSIDVSGYSEVTFEYRRKLVGLDTADDFEVSYFNGAWVSLEHLGSGSANDASYVFKSYPIPAIASKIRFKCEVGAVSESCSVDNVRITAQ
ncbi:hypothetical protein AUJ84_02375 [Candidatus Pacearchaeota archaeon CG1_02_32_132]|nr:MAG: hypothetical protein AUJ84_02375 [Candidatus Pacearchaeota archaeon CG1_02_32_132]